MLHWGGQRLRPLISIVVFYTNIHFPVELQEKCFWFWNIHATGIAMCWNLNTPEVTLEIVLFLCMFRFFSLSPLAFLRKASDGPKSAVLFSWHLKSLNINEQHWLPSHAVWTPAVYDKLIFLPKKAQCDPPPPNPVPLTLGSCSGCFLL